MPRWPMYSPSTIRATPQPTDKEAIMKYLFLILFLFTGQALANGVNMPIRAKIIQCGTYEEAADKCFEDEFHACCAVLLPIDENEEELIFEADSLEVIPVDELDYPVATEIVE